MAKRNFELGWLRPNLLLFTALIVAFFSQNVFAHDEDIRSTTELLLKRIQLINSKPDCPEGHSLPSISSLNSTFCENIERAPARFCEPVWPNQQKPWERPATKAFAANYASSERKVPSYNDQLKSGLKLINPVEEMTFLNQAAQIKKNMESNCCGSDKDCATAFRQVPVRFCSSLEATKNPDQPDSCALYSGLFDYSKEGYETFKNNMLFRAARHTLGDNESSLTPNQKLRMNLAYNKAMEKGETPNHNYIQTGEIVFNSYSYDNKPLPTSYTIAQELGHACSHIRRQIFVNKSTDARAAGEVAADKLSYFFNGGDECRLTPTTRRIYSDIVTQNESSGKMFQCLDDLAQNSNTPGSPSYFENSCPLRKLEESFAEGMALLSLQNISNAQLMYQCQSLPSTVHPASSDVITCALTSSPSFKQRARQAFECQ